MNRNVIRTLCALLIAVLLIGISSAALAEKEIPSKGIKLPGFGQKTPEMKDHSDRRAKLRSNHKEEEEIPTGEVVTLTVDLTGYEDATSVTITWQYSPDGETYFDTDAHGETYSFAMTPEMDGYHWRAKIVAVDEE